MNSKKNRLSTPNKQKGSTLIEVLIALLVFTVGLQGIVSMQYQSVKDNFDSSQRSHGVWAAQELINRIRANPNGRVSVPPNASSYSFNGNPCDANEPNPFCADRQAGPAAPCDSAQIATFDIWESVCSTPNQAHNQGRGQLFNPNLTITCADAPCTQNSQFTLNLQWQSKSVSDDDTTDGTLQTEQFSQVFRP